MTNNAAAHFDREHQTHFKHVKLKGLQYMIIEACALAVHRIGAYFDHRIDELSEALSPIQ